LNLISFTQDVQNATFSFQTGHAPSKNISHSGPDAGGFLEHHHLQFCLFIFQLNVNHESLKKKKVYASHSVVVQN